MIKILKSKLSNKQIVKEPKRATLIIKEPEENRNKYFKHSWKEEKKNLFMK